MVSDNEYIESEEPVIQVNTDNEAQVNDHNEPAEDEHIEAAETENGDITPSFFFPEEDFFFPEQVTKMPSLICAISAPVKALRLNISSAWETAIFMKTCSRLPIYSARLVRKSFTGRVNRQGPPNRKIPGILMILQ